MAIVTSCERLQPRLRPAGPRKSILKIVGYYLYSQGLVYNTICCHPISRYMQHFLQLLLNSGKESKHFSFSLHERHSKLIILPHLRCTYDVRELFQQLRANLQNLILGLLKIVLVGTLHWLVSPQLKMVSYKLLPSIHLYLFKGYYMYMEASSPHQRGDEAKLYSPPLKFFGIMCLEFYYYISGATTGSLTVTINETVVFSASGDKGDIWHKASINISSTVGFHWVSIN